MTPRPQRIIDTTGATDAASLAIAALEDGEPIIIPTDTVYGLAARAEDHVAKRKIFSLKGRPDSQTLAILVADVAQAATLVQVSADFERLAKAFWPGGLTIVAPPAPGVPPSLGAEDGWIGVRAPQQSWVRKLADSVGPLAATSANLHGRPTPESIAEIHEAFPATLLFDGGPGGTVASTIVRLETTGHTPIVVLREGAISSTELLAVLGPENS